MEPSDEFNLHIRFQLLAKWPFAVLDTFVIAPFEIVVFCSKKQTVLDTFIVIRLALLPIWKVHFDTRSAPDPRSFLKCWSNLGTIYILRKDIGVGSWNRKWQPKPPFSITSIFEPLYFLKSCPIFDELVLPIFSKYNGLLWVYWFLAKNLAFYDPPFLKFHNQTDINV